MAIGVPAAIAALGIVGTALAWMLLPWWAAVLVCGLTGPMAGFGIVLFACTI